MERTATSIDEVLTYTAQGAAWVVLQDNSLGNEIPIGSRLMMIPVQPEERERVPVGQICFIDMGSGCCYLGYLQPWELTDKGMQCQISDANGHTCTKDSSQILGFWKWTGYCNVPVN